MKKEQKLKLKKFAKFVIRELEIDSPPRILIQNNRNRITTTAGYDYTLDEKIVRVYAKNRMLVDVMRSLAHELVHHKQFERGDLKIRPADIGSPAENEANAKAGELIKKFALTDKSIYTEQIGEKKALNEQWRRLISDFIKTKQ